MYYWINYVFVLASSVLVGVTASSFVHHHKPAALLAALTTAVILLSVFIMVLTCVERLVCKER